MSRNIPLKLYNSNIQLKKNSNKLNYFSASIWRKVFFSKSSTGSLLREVKIFNKSSAVPHAFQSFEVVIHNGHRFTKPRYMNKWCVGFKFGSFTLNRKVAKYKSKQSKKKKK